jgi:hypothetical protein
MFVLSHNVTPDANAYATNKAQQGQK